VGKALGRGVLASGQLGQHNGLPYTIIVYTTLQELESGCGQAVTATGSLLPMPTVIRMASNAYHYLTIFDKDTGRALHLGRTRRIASVRSTNCVARPKPGLPYAVLGPGGRTRDGRRLLLLAQANAFTRVGTGAGDALDLRHAALRRGWHTRPGGGVLHLTHGALSYRRRRAGRWSGEDRDRRGDRDRDRESTGKD
jgi:Domain of unknown function (DUF222)